MDEADLFGCVSPGQLAFTITKESTECQELAKEQAKNGPNDDDGNHCANDTITMKMTANHSLHNDSQRCRL